MRVEVAAKAVMTNVEGKILLLRKPDHWQAPGGKLELEEGEDLQAALIREIGEETGQCDFEIGEVVHTCDRRTNSGVVYRVDVYFRCHTLSDRITLSHEHIAYVWAYPHEFDNDVKPEFRKAIKMALG